MSLFYQSQMLQSCCGTLEKSNRPKQAVGIVKHSADPGSKQTHFTILKMRKTNTIYDSAERLQQNGHQSLLLL